MTTDIKCVCCGEIIPEGRQFCPSCEASASRSSEKCEVCGIKIERGTRLCATHARKFMEFDDEYGGRMPPEQIVQKMREDFEFESVSVSAVSAGSGTEEPEKENGVRVHTFESGAVRDVQVGKGRCDLMPLDVVAEVLYDDPALTRLHLFKTTGKAEYLIDALRRCAEEDRLFSWRCLCSMMLDVAVHYEEGLERYPKNNWMKGIPVDNFISSAVRHYLKYSRGDTDERHDWAFVWNILGAVWTCKHLPNLNPYPEKMNN